jgi:hypothetical protein
MHCGGSMTNFLTQFFCLLLFKATFTSFFKDKKSKESQNIRTQGFSYYFCMMIEGSRSRTVSGGSGSTTLQKWSPCDVISRLQTNWLNIPWKRRFVVAVQTDMKELPRLIQLLSTLLHLNTCVQI